MSDMKPPRNRTPGVRPPRRWYAIVVSPSRVKMDGERSWISAIIDPMNTAMREAEPSIRAADAKRRPAVLQVLPALVAGGVERGTVDVAVALAAAGWRSLVASAGGPMTRELDRAGVTHFTLPLAS